ncbi:MAG: sigma-54-dependent Fis family transcriptional regulator [Acidobacteria bacterium]|nr:MAG: sigma-54-dependent Fis family transcriptional regulator [Acidobacteriota bacterium]
MNTFDSRLDFRQPLPSKVAIFGQTEGMKGLWQVAERVASASVPILIVGERGTGKEVFARFIHSCSPGPNAQFLKWSLPVPDGHTSDGIVFRPETEGLVGEEDFGGNVNSVRRLCTLFVDEVSEAGPERQLELLQLVQGSRPFISRDGINIPVSLRVIATSTRDLEQEVAARSFRADLFSVLSAVTLRLPPLRERREDISELANYFWRIYSERFGCQPVPPGPQVIERLQQHNWPGNIRELENVMKRYVVLGAEGIKGTGHAEQLRRPVEFAPSSGHPVSLKEATREAALALERKIIFKTLQETQWNRRRTARVLNISYRALLYKIKAAGLMSEEQKASVRVSEILKASENAA